MREDAFRVDRGALSTGSPEDLESGEATVEPLVFLLLERLSLVGVPCEILEVLGVAANEGCGLWSTCSPKSTWLNVELEDFE